MFEKFHTFATVFVVVLFLVFIGLYLHQKDDFRREYADMTKVQAELTRRAADDCVLTRTSYGYQCVEIKSGRVFKVAVNE
jgi:hypothetical protein